MRNRNVSYRAWFPVPAGSPCPPRISVSSKTRSHPRRRPSPACSRRSNTSTASSKPSRLNVEIHYAFPSRALAPQHGCVGFVADRLRLARRPDQTTRRADRAVADRQSGGKARLQTGTDADADTAARHLQSQFIVAERLAGIFQRSARASGRRHFDRQGQHQRHRAIPGPDPTQPDDHRRYRNQQLPRRQRDSARRPRTSCRARC